jgi:hypothetical protein
MISAGCVFVSSEVYAVALFIETSAAFAAETDLLLSPDQSDKQTEDQINTRQHGQDPHPN